MRARLICRCACGWPRGRASHTCLFFFSSRRRHTRCGRDWSSDVCSSDLIAPESTTLFPYADARHHSVRLRALLPQTETALYPGQWAKLRIQTGERDAILVPSTSILQRGELAGVYVLIDGQPRLRQVRAGELFNGQTEILSGLKAGDQIIVDALAQLADLSSKQ